MKVLNSTNYKGVIEQCYATDEDLLAKYHALAPTTYEKAVEDTVAVFELSQKLGTLKFYEIREADRLMGYFGVDHLGKYTTLSGFFIMPEYRTREFVQRFWRLVRSKMPSTFYCAVYQKNERAKKFLKKKGFSYFSTTFIPNHQLYSDIFKYN